MPFPLKIALAMENLYPDLIRGSLGPPKWHLNWFSCLSLWQKIPILYNGCSFPTKLPLPMGGTTPHIIQFLEPIQAHNLNSISTGSAVFAQMTAKCPYISQWATPSPLKIAPSNEGCGSHLINGSLGPAKSSTKRISQSVQTLLQGSIV